MEFLLSDKHDLTHKAIGWALRETGKISCPALLQFLQKRYNQMPRTALRYAIEHLPPQARNKHFLAFSLPTDTGRLHPILSGNCTGVPALSTQSNSGPGAAFMDTQARFGRPIRASVHADKRHRPTRRCARLSNYRTEQ
ncbi:MAG: DNA alkylation repair protein [Bryobacteraceae bacterium]